MAGSNGVFSNVESTKKDGYEIRKRNKYIFIGFASVFLIVLALGFSRTNEISRDFFFVDYRKINSIEDLMNLDFNFPIFILVFFLIFAALHNLTKENDKNGLIDYVLKFFFLPLKIVYGIFLKIWKAIDKNKKDDPEDTFQNLFFRIFFMPFNFIFFHETEKKEFQLRPKWYKKIRNDFFMPTHNKVDEI